MKYVTNSLPVVPLYVAPTSAAYSRNSPEPPYVLKSMCSRTWGRPWSGGSTWVNAPARTTTSRVATGAVWLGTTMTWSPFSRTVSLTTSGDCA